MVDPKHILERVQEINSLEMCVRALIVFAYGLIAVRLAGRRVFGHWSALDIVVSLIVGSNLSRALAGASAMIPILASTTLLLVLHWILAMAVVRWRGLAVLVEGKSVDLGRDGQIDHRQCAAAGVSKSDMDEALRQGGLESEADTRRITLEPSGKISVLKKN